MGVGQKVVVPSTSADFNNYTYKQVIVTGPGGIGAEFNVTFNGVAMSLTNGMVFDMDVFSVETGSEYVFLSGYLITYDFPVYLGNSWATDYQGMPIIQSNEGGVFAQSGNTQYAFYK
jgi:hypothetical protein